MVAKLRTAIADGTPLAAAEPARSRHHHQRTSAGRPGRTPHTTPASPASPSAWTPSIPTIFARITRVPAAIERVLAGVRAAQRAGLGPVKVNCVLLRGFNDDQIVPFAHFSRDEGVIVRFIEFMPLEEDRFWTPDVVVPLQRDGRHAQPASRPLVAAARQQPGRNRPPLHLRLTASAKSASSRPSPRPFAEHAAASASPPTARSAPASSPTSTMISTACCAAAAPTTISPPSSRRR